jgi:hypothetical protein
MHPRLILLPVLVFLLSFRLPDATTDICDDLQERYLGKSEQKVNAYFKANPPVPEDPGTNEHYFRVVDAFLEKLEKEPCIESAFYSMGRGFIMKSYPAQIDLTVKLQTREGKKRNLIMRLYFTNPIMVGSIGEKDQ